ncbi:LuxR family transcriptional regulator [Paractinoplanes abujensis]|uniref:DNA-binding CsgD family transcriptional regulator n=1 Tax=Paractinoplanes abujensis TaxID=882441 RepID=A0A7W7CQQ2_9ACTN|nr:LuxR family transcriptional regulator [Actinoplanes abujensis]MBB4692908.1 DNA-binding CsgD family transcriptional regulator [Actinoplanes abujensis]GID22592.1 LuxR family transcriptional regulator [Actinoplanes abujensis]
MTLFVGRAGESEQLRACADEVRAGGSRLAVIEGEAGIGKSALLSSFAESLSDFTVLRATADSSETDFPYGVIGQLASRVAPEGSLAAPAADASPHVIGGQLLLLLGELQKPGRPVAVIVDDLHWADRQSTRALGFVLRRLWSDRVLTLLATRPAAEPLDQLLRSADQATKVLLGGLDGDAVARLAGVMLEGPLTPGLIDRLHDYTGGHPLHLRTVLAEVPADVLRDEGLRRWPVPRSLLVAIKAQLDRLPAESRDLLDALAVLDARVPLAAAGRLAGLADPARALGPALAAGLAVWWPNEPQSPVGLVHSLQRDALYDALGPGRRRVLHAGAAHLVGTAASWAHRVAAASTTDEGLAAELEQSGLAEAAAGRNAVAATRLRWASALSAGRDDRERRLLTACAQSLLTLRADTALPLRPQVEDCAPGPLRSCVLGIMDMMTGRIPTAEAHLRQAREEPGAGWVAALAALFLAQITIAGGRGAETVEIARQTLTIGDLDPATTDLARALVATGRMWHAGPRAALDDLTHLPESSVDVRDDNLDTLATRGVMRLFLGHLPGARTDLRTVALRDQQGASSRLGPATLALQSVVHYLAGEWDESASAADRARAVAVSQDQLAFDAAGRFASVCVDAGRGDWDRAERRLGELATIVQSFGSPPDIVYSSLAAATVAQARADDAGLLQALQPLLTGTSLRYQPFRLWQQALLAEALTGAGRLDDAEAVLHDLRDEHDGGYLRDVVARLGGRIAEARNRPGDAEETYRRALVAEVDDDTAPLYRARLEHSYGKLLLATGSASRRDAATWLTRAHRRFGTLRAEPFRQRCEQDLTAAGLTTADSHPGRPLTLTERELSVAHVIAQGRTNQEAAAELYVSQKTVEYHLSRIYAKLGISSRRLLADALRDPSLGV